MGCHYWVGGSCPRGAGSGSVAGGVGPTGGTMAGGPAGTVGMGCGGSWVVAGVVALCRARTASRAGMRSVSFDICAAMSCTDFRAMLAVA